MLPAHVNIFLKVLNVGSVGTLDATLQERGPQAGRSQRSRTIEILTSNLRANWEISARGREVDSGHLYASRPLACTPHRAFRDHIQGSHLDDVECGQHPSV